MTDEELVKKFLRRDEEAISDAKEQYENYCMYIARNVLSDRGDAEECVNDVLLAAWDSIPPQRPENLKTYLGKLTRRIAINRLNRDNAKKRDADRTAVSLDEIEEIVGESTVEASVETSELSRKISEFLRSLRETERNVFIRRYWYGDSIESICVRFGFGKSKTVMMLKRTRDKLSDYLKKEVYLI